MNRLSDAAWTVRSNCPHDNSTSSEVPAQLTLYYVSIFLAWDTFAMNTFELPSRAMPTEKFDDGVAWYNRMSSYVSKNVHKKSMSSVESRPTERATMDLKKIVLTLIAGGMLVSVAEAQTARRAGMNNHTLIEDHDDVYTYPQKASSKYNQNRAKFDWDANGSNSGTIFSGAEGSAWGLAVSKMGAPAVDNGGGAYPEAVQTADVYYATKAAGGDVGFRLGYAGGSTEAGNAESSHQDINLGLGYSVASHDLSVAIDYGMAEVKDASEGSGLGVNANYRGYLKNRAGNNVDLGVLASVVYGSNSDKPNGGDSADTSGLGLGFGAGPVFRAGDSTVALLAGMGYASNTAANDDENSALVLPAVNLAMESPMNDWVTFRGGIGYAKAMTTASRNMGDESSDTAGTTTFALGMTAKWNRLDFDVALNRDFLTKGPYAFTGTETPGWASQVSATFAW